MIERELEVGSNQPEAPNSRSPRTSLRRRLVGSFLSLSLITVALVATVVFYQSREALRGSKFDSLSAVAVLKEGVLNRWVDEQRNSLATFSELTTLSGLVARLDTDALNREQAEKDLRLFLISAAERADLTELYVLAPSGGEVLASTDPDRVGDYRVDDLFYQRGKVETFVQNVYASPVTSRPTLTIATPVKDRQGITRAVLVANLNLARIDAVLADGADLGQTGEAYLVSAFNDFVSAERFGRDEFLRGVHTEGVHAALSGRSGTGLYKNYAGVPVIGAYRWIPDRELVLLVELGQKEAFAPARALVTSILAIGFISALLLTWGVYSMARQIADPIVDLASAAQRVALGDFSVSAAVSTDDEVGVLASAFNRMTVQLDELYRNLEEQIEARTTALEELALARDDAEAATQAKTDFLARMSHEIRTPLNAVIGMAHLMGNTVLDETQKDYTKKIQGSGEHLLAVINEILDFSRMEAKSLELEQTPFELDEILEQLPLAQTNPDVEIVFQVRPDVPARLIGDPLRLSQLLTNLIGNALKFTRHGEIHLLVERLSQPGSDSDAELRFQVRDTGVGFDSAKAERLFESFSQADGSTTRRHGGSGLGLAICRQIVELMGGRIWADAQLGVGATFSFDVRLPLDNTSVEADRDLFGKKALVFHPHATTLRAIEECLTAQCVNVTEVDSAEALRAELAEHPSYGSRFDIIVADWRSFPIAMNSIPDADVLRRLPTILLAGVEDRAVVHHTTSSWERARVLEVPFVRSSLIRSVRASLSADSRFHSGAHDRDETAATTPPTALLQGRTLLVVDDNEINQQVVCGLLSHAGASAKTALGGRQALAMLERTRFDAVILDIRMPDMDGFELAQAIRKRESASRLPLIALSADPLARDDERASRDIDEYLTKPIDPKRLIDTVALHMSGSSYSESVQPATSEVKIVGESRSADEAAGAAVLDVGAGLARAAGDEGLYLRLLGSFVAGQTDTADEVESALADERFGNAEDRLHDLKGIAANLGADCVACVAERLLGKLRTHSGQPIAIDSSDCLELGSALIAVQEAVASMQATQFSLKVNSRPNEGEREGSALQETFP